jgi:dUTP pyrophosphatase
MMNEIPVEIKLLNDEAKVPVYARPGDAGFDLIAMEDVYIHPGATEIVPTGLAVAIPEGFELQVRPRSGVSAKTFLRVANAPGTVDSGYRGEVGVIIDNTAPIMDGMVPHVYTIDGEKENIDVLVPPLTYKIRKGDRIAQGVIAPVYRAVFQEVDELDETERGAGGFGSTGMTAK